MTREEIQYFFPDDFPGPLRCVCCGVSHCDGSYRITRPPQNIFVFEYVEKGLGELNVDGRMFYPRSGDVYLAPGWRAHSYGSSANDPWTKYWFNLSGAMPETLLKLYHLEGTFLFQDAAAAGEYLKEGVLRMKTVKRTELPDFLEPFFLGLVRLLAKHVSPAERICEDERILRLNRFLRDRITRPMPTLEEIAAAVGASVPQTIRISKRESGLTPCDRLISMKIDAAKELLPNSGMSVKEIANLLGFTDEYYFARVFRRRCGISPGRFRKSL